MTRPVFNQTFGKILAGQQWHQEQLQRRRYPSDWYEVGNDNGETSFVNSWAAPADATLQPLQYRDSGFDTPDLEGMVEGGTPGTVVTTLPAWVPAPAKTVTIAGTVGTDAATAGWAVWRLDPNRDLYLLAAVQNIAGAVGPTGPAGADGSIWYSGAGAPAGGLGDIPDFYLNTSNGDVYTKASGVWVQIENLTGPTGATGATGAAGADGAPGADSGIGYTYSTDTASSDPGSGKVKFNSTTLASINSCRISETDRFSNGIAAFIQSWDDSTSTVRGYLIMVGDGAATNLLILQVTGSVTDNGTWDSFSVTYITSAGSFANNDNVRLFFTRTGDKGDTGAGGSVTYTVATTVAGLGTAEDGKVGLIRAGSSPFDFLLVVYDATYGKWVSDAWCACAYTSGSTATRTGVTTYGAVGDNFKSYTPWRVLNTAGLSDQYRVIALLSCSGGATGSVAVILQGYDTGGALAATLGTEFSVGSTTSATAVGVDGGWVEASSIGTVTAKDFMAPHSRFKTSNAAQTVTLTQTDCQQRWVG